MILIQQNKLTVRTLTEEDAFLLVKWLSNPVVLEYYEGRDRVHDLELVKKHFLKTEIQLLNVLFSMKVRK